MTDSPEAMPSNATLVRRAFKHRALQLIWVALAITDGGGSVGIYLHDKAHYPYIHYGAGDALLIFFSITIATLCLGYVASVFFFVAERDAARRSHNLPLVRRLIEYSQQVYGKKF